MADPNLNLDVSVPEDVAVRLRRTVEAYNHTACELTSAWQDERAGKVWAQIARELDRSSDRIERIVKRHMG